MLGQVWWSNWWLKLLHINSGAGNFENDLDANVGVLVKGPAKMYDHLASLCCKLGLHLWITIGLLWLKSCLWDPASNKSVQWWESDVRSDERFIKSHGGTPRVVPARIPWMLLLFFSWTLAPHQTLNFSFLGFFSLCPWVIKTLTFWTLTMVNSLFLKMIFS